jgi:hypothetical protein
MCLVETSWQTLDWFVVGQRERSPSTRSADGERCNLSKAIERGGNRRSEANTDGLRLLCHRRVTGLFRFGELPDSISRNE